MSKEAHPSIALCLSGGGLRATFFHLGVVRYLADAGLLGSIQSISAVSGGSILAAHLALNWSRYKGTPTEFENAANELIRLGVFDLRGRIVRRWLLLAFFLPFRWCLLLLRTLAQVAHLRKTTVRVTNLLYAWSRTGLLQAYYDSQLFHRAPLRSLVQADGVPEFHLLSTSLTTGCLCSFDGTFFVIDSMTKLDRFAAGSVPLAMAVTASSAFPPLFPPVQVTRRTLGANDTQLPYDAEILTDGGVFDNLGVRKILRLREEGHLKAETIICSDAGASFEWEVSRSFSSIIARTVRATDILMKRVGDFEEASQRGDEFIVCSIRQPVPRARVQESIDEDLQTRISRIRTDLDRFDPKEIALLIRHGYSVGASRLGHLRRDQEDNATGDAAPGARWAFLRDQNEKSGNFHVVDLLDESHFRRLGLWNARDWTSWLIALLVLVIPLASIASFSVTAALIKNILIPERTTNVEVSISGSRSVTASELTPFQASSGQINVGCDSIANGVVRWALPPGARIEGQVRANWINTNNLTSAQASPAAELGNVVSAEGTIRGLNSQSLPFGIRNCPGGGHGELVLAGQYRGTESRPINFQLDGRLAADSIAFTLPSEQDVAVREIRITLAASHGGLPSSITIPITPGATRFEARSSDGRYVAEMIGRRLTVTRRS